MNQPVINIIRRGVSYEEYSSFVAEPISKDKYLDLVIDRITDITWELEEDSSDKNTDYSYMSEQEMYAFLSKYSGL